MTERFLTERGAFRTMGLGSRLLKNIGYLTVGSQVGNLLQFLFFLFFARSFGQEVVGQYSFAFSFTFLFLIGADLGLGTYLIREVAREGGESRELFARCLSLRVMSVSLSLMSALAIVLLFPGSFGGRTREMILLIGLYQVFFSLADVFLAELKGHDRMGRVALLSLFARFMVVGVGLALMFFQFDANHVLACYPVGGFVYLVLTVMCSFRVFGTFRLTWSRLNLKQLFMANLPFTFTIVLVEFLYHQDILLLKWLEGDKAVGILSPANNIVMAFMGMGLFVHTALLPSFSILFVEAKSKLVEVAGQSVRYLVMIGLPVGVGLFGISDRLMPFLFSERFVASGEVMKILCWTLTLSFAGATYSVLLTAIDRQTEKVVATGVCVGVNLMANVFLIPKLGYEGTAAARVITEGLHLGLMVFLVSRYLGKIPFASAGLKALVGCCGMYVFVECFSDLNLALVIVLGGLIYLGVLGLIGGFTREELQVAKRMLERVGLGRGSGGKS
jgi:O-antigen/teichoic acid export membrane protein